MRVSLNVVSFPVVFSHGLLYIAEKFCVPFEIAFTSQVKTPPTPVIFAAAGFWVYVPFGLRIVSPLLTDAFQR